jgi:aspartate racemase
MRPVRLGIIGNMSPEADELFQAHVRAASGAVRDQEHLCVLVAKNPDIPDRSAHILGAGLSPVPEIVRSAQLLERAGAQLLAMPCNTAHYFHAEIQAGTGAYLLHMIEEAAACAGSELGSETVGLLATTGTVRTRLYHDALAVYGIGVVTPGDATQAACVHEAIYGKGGLKTGSRERGFALLCEAVSELRRDGAVAVILGCTEMPLVAPELRDAFPDMMFLDPMKIVAKQAVSVYKRAEEMLRARHGNPALFFRVMLPPPRGRSAEAIAEYVAGRATAGGEAFLTGF